MSAKRAKAQRNKVEPVLPFREVPIQQILAAGRRAGKRPVAAFQSPQFLAAVYVDPSGYTRLSVNRVRQTNGMWDDGISWDELQKIKSLIGFGDAWAVEAYPPDSEVVNVANIRHLFLLPSAPPFGWSGP